jgi:G3E family GTPase
MINHLLHNHHQHDHHHHQHQQRLIICKFEMPLVQHKAAAEVSKLGNP